MSPFQGRSHVMSEQNDPSASTPPELTAPHPERDPITRPFRHAVIVYVGRLALAIPNRHEVGIGVVGLVCEAARVERQLTVEIRREPVAAHEIAVAGSVRAMCERRMVDPGAAGQIRAAHYEVDAAHAEVPVRIHAHRRRGPEFVVARKPERRPRAHSVSRHRRGRRLIRQEQIARGSERSLIDDFRHLLAGAHFVAAGARTVLDREFASVDDCRRQRRPERQCRFARHASVGHCPASFRINAANRMSSRRPTDGSAPVRT